MSRWNGTFIGDSNISKTVKTFLLSKVLTIIGSTDVVIIWNIGNFGTNKDLSDHPVLLHVITNNAYVLSQSTVHHF